MAAYIVRPNDREWKILEKILAECEDGAIVIPPPMQQWLKEQGVEAKAGTLVDYDFEGEADILVDVMDRIDHHALLALDPDLWERVNDDLRDGQEKPVTEEHGYGPGQAEAAARAYQRRMEEQ